MLTADPLEEWARTIVESIADKVGNGHGVFKDPGIAPSHVYKWHSNIRKLSVVTAKSRLRYP